MTRYVLAAAVLVAAIGGYVVGKAQEGGHEETQAVATVSPDFRVVVPGVQRWTEVIDYGDDNVTCSIETGECDPFVIEESLVDVEPTVILVEAPRGILDRETAVSVLRASGWPDELIDAALAVAWCESRWRPDAVGDSGNSLGWFQLWTGWFAAAGEDLDAWADPLVNARVALYVYNARGRFGGGGGWTCADLLGIW